MYHILIAGAGYTGEKIGQYFAAKKQKVYGTTRRDERKSELEALGILPIIADLTQPETLNGIPRAHFVVICPAPDERTIEGYQSVYLDGVANLLSAMRKNPQPFLTVYLSSTSVYGEKNGEWVDEETPAVPDSEYGRILLQAERQVLASGFPAVIFRLAGIYGPGRNRIAAIRKGKYEVPSENGYMNMIHIDDIVETIPLLFKSGNAGEVYLGVDDSPVKKSVFYEWLTRELKIPAGHFSENKGKPIGKRCSNQKIKKLGKIFKHPNFKSGYQAILSELKMKGTAE